MSNQRAQERVGLTNFQQVRDAGTGEVLGYVADITTDGMRLVGKKRFEIGDQREVQLRYVRFGGEVEAPRIELQCIWNGEVEGALSAESGFCFVRTDDESRASIDRILEDLKKRE